MQIKIKGEMSIAELRQAIFEKMQEAESEFGVRYSRGATVYINPTNGFGDNIQPCNRHRQTVEKLYSEGPYKSVADDYKL